MKLFGKGWRLCVFAVALPVIAALPWASAQEEPVTITYWQYVFDSRVEAMDQLIAQFEAENPGIRVIHETFPYANYEDQVAASLPAGLGPDVVQLFYGWLGAWSRAGYIEPLPEAFFDTAAIDEAFVPMTQAAKLDGLYYGLPTAVRSLALFYNQDMFDEVGIEAPPSTWEEFIAAAAALTVQRGPRFERIGFGLAPGGQDHHLLREVLTRQFGTAPYSEDGRSVLYGGEEGLAAFEFYLSLVTEHGVASVDFPGQETGAYRDGFAVQESIGMIFDGSFAIGTIGNRAEFTWGVTEIPVHDDGVQANFGSFWMNSLTPNAFVDEARLEASAKFLEFVTSEDAMRLWLEVVGELPARQVLIEDPELAADPILGPFISSLAYATATQFVDESAQRQLMVDAINRVLINEVDPASSWQQAAAEDQALLDQFAR